VQDLIQEIDRFTALERAFEVADSNFGDTTKVTIRSFIEKALAERKGTDADTATKQEPKAPEPDAAS
jgi:hypothetical protein